MLTPTFHFNVLQGYQDVFSVQAEVLTKQLMKETGKFFDVFPYIKRCALDIICGLKKILRETKDLQKLQWERR